MTAEMFIRMSAFAIVFGLLTFWEVWRPRRRLVMSKVTRWVANLSVVLLDAMVVRLLFGAGAVGMALLATDRHWGIMNHVEGPLWSEAVLAVIVLDLILYIQHVLFHAVPLLWRFHMMHHADMDCDVTTGVRFHPVEVVLSMVIKLSVIVVLGPSPAAVLTFEMLLNATSMFNHSNVRMPVAIDRALRWIVVTPDMHRVHHSVLPRETNTNFGFNVSWWDRLLGTYRAEPAGGHEGMTLGLEQLRDPVRQTIIGILILPFVGEPGNYPLSRIR
jgi:sterol desaturase/sphingolipid hydroxylase (fatty acid hydroxylase superfamily)